MQQMTIAVLIFSVVLLSGIMIGTDSLTYNSSFLQLEAFAQFLEICDNFVDDDGDTLADTDDPEGCSPAGETTTPLDIITYPDGTTCDPNIQSCPPPEDTSASSLPPPPPPSLPAEDTAGMMTCPDGSIGTSCPPEESVAPASTACDPNAQTLQRGDNGDLVVALQNLLIERGYNPGVVDGDFGPGTEGAVIQFQTDSGLSADGIVGPETWGAICTAMSGQQPPVTEQQAPAGPPSCQPSGASLVSTFLGSREINDLEPTFGASTKRFVDAIENAGGTVQISATKRPPERAYMMHWAWRIVNENYDANKVSPFKDASGWCVNWWHGDQETSKAAAQEMVNAFGIKNLRVPPSLSSRHIEGKAIDMSISWAGDLTIAKSDGTPITITTVPRDGTNAELITVGQTYGVIHFKDVNKDKPHWSTDGR